jgi:hypothetical protein
MKYANKTVDILDNLLTDVPDVTMPGVSELCEFIYQKNQPTGPVLMELPTDNASHAEMPRKKKVTYYLSKKVLVELYDAKAKIKVLVPANVRRKVSLSRIVDFAVEAILDEFKKVGKKSELVQQILNND